jgi:hypothetical protein
LAITLTPIATIALIAGLSIGDPGPPKAAW